MPSDLCPLRLPALTLILWLMAVVVQTTEFASPSPAPALSNASNASSTDPTTDTMTTAHANDVPSAPKMMTLPMPEQMTSSHTTSSGGSEKSTMTRCARDKLSQKTSTASPNHRLRSTCYAPASGDIELHIVGLFGINGSYPVGRAFLFAAELAVEDVNARPDVLPGYRLVLDTVNTQCTIAAALDGLYRRLYSDKCTLIMVMGGTCSDVSEQAAHASYKYNLVQISYSALSPRLSNVTEFPWFFRLMAPESYLSKVRLELLKKYNWDIITMLQASEHLFTSTVEHMRDELLKNNYIPNNTLPFSADPGVQIEELQKMDARIIFFAAYEDQARKAICAAYKRGFYGSHIVWILAGFFDIKWYDHDDFNCTAEQKLRVINGYFSVSNVNLAEEDGEETVGATASQYKSRFRAKVREYRRQHGLTRLLGDQPEPGEIRAPLSYDTLWAIALALNSTLTALIRQGYARTALSQFSYANCGMGELIYSSMKATTFRGLSGNVTFTVTGDRLPAISIQQFHVINFTTREAEMKIVGLYTNARMKWFNENVIFEGGVVPKAKRLTEHVLKPLPWRLYLSMCFLAAVGVVLCLGFLVFNVKNRNVRLIRMSSPKINNIILIGCMLVYVTVSLGNVKGQRLDVLCHVRLYLMVLGFSLGFGALFAKTWRVYEIMTASRRLSKVTKDLSDRRLLLTVGVVAAINLCVLITWTATDTLTMTPVDIEGSAVERVKDVVEISQTLVCRSRYKVHFTLALLSLQGLLILFGAFLAVQTRKMTIPELNDSRWIGMCIYNVVVLGSLGAILVLGTRQSPDVAFLLESVIVILGTSLTQCLVFVPKLLSYRRLRQGRSDSQQNILTVRSVYVHGSKSSIRSLASADFPGPVAADPPSVPFSIRSSGDDTALTDTDDAGPGLGLLGCCWGRGAGRKGAQRDRGSESRDSPPPAVYMSRAVSVCSFLNTMGKGQDEPGDGTGTTNLRCSHPASPGDPRGPQHRHCCRCCCSHVQRRLGHGVPRPALRRCLSTEKLSCRAGGGDPWGCHCALSAPRRDASRSSPVSPEKSFASVPRPAPSAGRPGREACGCRSPSADGGRHPRGCYRPDSGVYSQTQLCLSVSREERVFFTQVLRGKRRFSEVYPGLGFVASLDTVSHRLIRSASDARLDIHPAPAPLTALRRPLSLHDLNHM